VPEFKVVLFILVVAEGGSFGANMPRFVVVRVFETAPLPRHHLVRRLQANVDLPVAEAERLPTVFIIVHFFNPTRFLPVRAHAADRRLRPVG
jgi:hypothetical protein